MTIRELQQALVGLKDEKIRVDFYDRDDLITRGIADRLEVPEPEGDVVLRACKDYEEPDDWELLEAQQQANPWTGDPIGCCHVYLTKNGKTCSRLAVLNHAGQPYCNQHYPPRIELNARERRESDEIQERLEEERCQQEQELEKRPGAMEVLPDSDTPFSVKSVPNSYRYLPDITSISKQGEGSWIVQVVTDVRHENTHQTEWEFELRVSSASVEIIVHTMRDYGRRVNRGPWKLLSEIRGHADRHTQAQLKHAATTVLLREVDVRSAKDEEAERKKKLRMILPRSDSRPN